MMADIDTFLECARNPALWYAFRTVRMEWNDGSGTPDWFSSDLVDVYEKTKKGLWLTANVFITPYDNCSRLPLAWTQNTMVLLPLSFTPDEIRRSRLLFRRLVSDFRTAPWRIVAAENQNGATQCCAWDKETEGFIGNGLLTPIYEPIFRQAAGLAVADEPTTYFKAQKRYFKEQK